MAQPV